MDMTPAEQWHAGHIGECQWFAMCNHPAIGLVGHPAFPDGVPCCQRCADRFDMELQR